MASGEGLLWTEDSGEGGVGQIFGAAKMTGEPNFFKRWKIKINCIYYSFTRSDQPGWGTTAGDGETKHLLLNASRLQCDMFAVLSSSDVWPKVIHFKHLACSALSLALYLSEPQLSCTTDTLFSLTPSFLSPVSVSCFLSLFLSASVCALSLSLSLTGSSSLSPSLPSLTLLPLCINISEPSRAWWWWDLIPHAGWSSPDIPRQADS